MFNIGLHEACCFAQFRSSSTVYIVGVIKAICKLSGALPTGFEHPLQHLFCYRPGMAPPLQPACEPALPRGVRKANGRACVALRILNQRFHIHLTPIPAAAAAASANQVMPPIAAGMAIFVAAAVPSVFLVIGLNL